MERERSLPKEKSRWNPKPEQIQILEKKFKSGMVTPPREEIKRIRAELEEFGHVEDVNVFYWFQNRKTRAKRKPRLPAAQRSKSRTNSGVPSSTSSTSTSTSTSVQSKPITDLPNSPANSMHNNIGDQYHSSDVPISSVAWNHYDLQAVNKEICHNQLNTMQVMQETTTLFQSKTLTGLSTISANIMHNNIGDQYYSSGAWHHHGLQGVNEEMSNYNQLNTMQPTSTTV